MAKILHVCPWFDPAGDVVRCVKELQKYSKYEHRLIISKDHPLHWYPTWINSSNPIDEFAWADAVLFHFVGWNDTHGWQIKPNKPYAFRNINIRYDAYTDKFWAEDQFNETEYEGYKLLASSHIGAADFIPNCKWLPDLIPINDQLYTPYLSKKKPCISYIKHWEELDCYDFNGVKRQKLFNTSHDTLLYERRREATCVIDNLCDGHFGLAGLESMSMGLPTIVFNHTVTQKALKELSSKQSNCYEYPPFIEVRQNLNDAVAAAIELSTATNSGSIRKWMVEYYQPKRIVKLYWDSFLEELLDRPL